MPRDPSSQRRPPDDQTESRSTFSPVLHPFRTFKRFFRTQEMLLLRQAFRDTFTGLKTGVVNGTTGATTPTENEVAPTDALTGDVRTETVSGTPFRYQIWRRRVGSGVFVAWQYNNHDGDYGVLDRSTDPTSIRLPGTLSGHGKATIPIRGTADGEIEDDYFEVLRPHTQRYVQFDTEPDHGSRSPIVESSGMKRTGNRIVGTVENADREIECAVQPWISGGDAVYISWRLGETVNRYGTLNENAVWLGRDSACTLHGTEVTTMLLEPEIAEELRAEVNRLRNASD